MGAAKAKIQALDLIPEDSVLERESDCAEEKINGTQYGVDAPKLAS
jgi:hypothetical protein